MVCDCRGSRLGCGVGCRRHASHHSGRPVNHESRRSPKPRRRISHENRLTWLTIGACVAGGVDRALFALVRGVQRESAMDSHARDRGIRVWLYREHARTSHPSVANGHELARGLAGRRLLDPGPGCAGERCAWAKRCLRSTNWAKPCGVQRLGAFEATALLRTIMAEIDVAVFTFDPRRKLRLVNRAGENLLKKPMDKLLGRTARELRLDVCLEADEDAPLTLAFPGATGRWGVRRSTFREHGLPNELLVLTDLSRTLREEERMAWQRLVRVLVMS